MVYRKPTLKDYLKRRAGRTPCGTRCTWSSARWISSTACTSATSCAGTWRDNPSALLGRTRADRFDSTRSCRQHLPHQILGRFTAEQRKRHAEKHLYRRTPPGCCLCCSTGVNKKLNGVLEPCPGSFPRRCRTSMPKRPGTTAERYQTAYGCGWISQPCSKAVT